MCDGGEECVGGVCGGEGGSVWWGGGGGGKCCDRRIGALVIGDAKFWR